MDDAIEHAADLAGLSEYKVTDYPRGNNLDEVLQALLEGRELDTSVDPASRVLRTFQEELQLLKSFNDPRGIYLLPEINFQFLK